MCCERYVQGVCMHLLFPQGLLHTAACRCNSCMMLCWVKVSLDLRVLLSAAAAPIKIDPAAWRAHFAATDGAAVITPQRVNITITSGKWAAEQLHGQCLPAPAACPGMQPNEALSADEAAAAISFLAWHVSYKRKPCLCTPAMPCLAFLRLSCNAHRTLYRRGRR